MRTFINLTLISFIFLIVHSGQLAAQSKTEYVQILNRFEQWKSYKIKKGQFESDKNCNPDTATKEGYKGAGMGIPKEIQIFYTDLNNDHKLDALITFFADQCDGGNALMNLQIKVLILSKGQTYFADDIYFDKIESRLKGGWIIIDKAGNGNFNGTYFEYKESDGRCCPSIRKPFTIGYQTKKLSFAGDE